MKKNIALAALAVGALTLTGCTSQAETQAAAASSSAAAASSAAASSSSAAAATSAKVAAAVEASKQRAAEAERQRLANEEANRKAQEALAVKMDRGTYEQISDRDFALLAKNPDAHKGRKLVVYGVVTQFDSATGTSTFRAETGGSPQDRYYDYDQNTMVSGLTPTFANVVEDDLVTLYVEVIGSYSYDTQTGGNTTVPKFFANIVDVTGSAA